METHFQISKFLETMTQRERGVKFFSFNKNFWNNQVFLSANYDKSKIFWRMNRLRLMDLVLQDANAIIFFNKT